MKKVGLLVFLFLPSFMYAEDDLLALNLGSTIFFMDTKIMEDGSITNVGFGLAYSSTWGGTIRGQITKISTNEESDNASDSLIANNETSYEVFLLPIQYKAKIDRSLEWWAGLGLYYEYQKSEQKGYLDMPVLRDYGREQVNSYSDDFSLHLFGPLMDVGVKYDAEQFSLSFSGGVVPVFFLTALEKQRMFPLLGAEFIEHSQNKTGVPYFYLGLDGILFKYVNLVVQYGYSQLKYDVISLGYDSNEKVFVPLFPERTVVSQSLIFEISAVIPLGGMGFQVGYGYQINFYTVDSDNPVSENKHCLILSGKKIDIKK